MYYSFLDQAPAFDSDIYLLSGEYTRFLPMCEYLFLHIDNKSLLFEIQYKIHCSPFKEVWISGSTLAVGHEEYCYLYDLKSMKHIVTIAMDSYFGHLYVYGRIFYITDACKLIAVDELGEILWKSEELGIDGVVIKKIEDSKIYGEGEWDPPGGWVNFILDLKTGKS
jgi:hypothetical protein